MARGLFRLWLIGSALWVGLALYAYKNGDGLAYLFADSRLTTVVFGLPVAAGVFLAGLMWVVGGFSAGR